VNRFFWPALELVGRLVRRLERWRPGVGVVNFRGKGVVNVIDVGAVGDLPSPWHENAPSIRHLLRFEPREEASQTPWCTTVKAALWEKAGERDFYVYAGMGGVGSSLLDQNFEYVREHYDELKHRGPRRLAETWFERSKLERVERIKCMTLDEVLSSLDHPFPYHFVKIDAQGAEYNILRGFEEGLRGDCIGLQLELFTVPLYRGITLLPDVVDYLRDFDLELVKKFPAHGTFDSQHDCVFLKNGAQGEVADTVRAVYGLPAG